MKANRQGIGRAVDQPDRDVRFYLFHGPDEAQSRALGGRLAQALEANRFLLASSTIKSDPAALTDEAGAMSLFGGARVIWIEPAGEEIAPAVESLLQAAIVESPVVAICGTLRKASLLRLTEASPIALAFAAYAPEGADAARMVIDIGRRFGLKIDDSIAARIADSCGNDQAIVSREIEKLSLYVDASPQSPKDLDPDALDAVAAELTEENAPRLVDLALSGNLAGLAEDLANLPDGIEPIPAVRALQRRLLMLAPARARIDRGETPDAAMTSLGKSLFWKDKPLVARLLSRWDSKSLATVAERVGQLERSLILTPAPGLEALSEELFAIARAAQRR